jgi:hypothetical protein
VAELVRKLAVHLHEIQTARPNVARVEHDIVDTVQVLVEVAATVVPKVESVLRPVSWHVLDGDANALPSSVF